MAHFREARFSQRILSFLIDYFFIRIIGSFVYDVTLYLIKFDIDEYYKMYSSLITDYTDILLGNSNISDAFINDMKNVLILTLIMLGVELLALLVVSIIYLVILPRFTSWQTIGRAITKCNVVSNDYSKVKLGKLIIREIFGFYFLYLLFVFPIVISIFLVRKNGLSITDRMAKTRVVDCNNVIIEVEPDEYTPEGSKDIYNDLNKERFSYFSKKEDQNISDEDDEYKVF